MLLTYILLKKGENGMNNQNEVLALQEMEYGDGPDIEGRATSTPICTAAITAVSGVVAASVSAAWNSSITLGCGK